MSLYDDDYYTEEEDAIRDEEYDEMFAAIRESDDDVEENRHSYIDEDSYMLDRPSCVRGRPIRENDTFVADSVYISPVPSETLKRTKEINAKLTVPGYMSDH